MPDTTRVVIAEDEAIIRLDLKELLEEEGYEVVGETGRGDEAIELVVHGPALKSFVSKGMDSDVRAKLDAQGLDMSGQTGPEFAADIRAQSERWARIIKASGYKAD